MSVTSTTGHKSHGFLEHVNSGRKNLRKLYTKDQDRLREVVVREYSNSIRDFLLTAIKPENKTYDYETHTFRDLQADEERLKPDAKAYRDFLLHRVSVIAQEFVGGEKEKEESVRNYLLYKLGVGEYSSAEEYVSEGKGNFHTAHAKLGKVLTKVHDATFLSGEEKAQKKKAESEPTPELLEVGEEPQGGAKGLNADDSGDEAALFDEHLEQLESTDEVKKSGESETEETADAVKPKIEVKEGDDDAVEDGEDEDCSVSGSEDSESSSGDDEYTSDGRGVKRKLEDSNELLFEEEGGEKTDNVDGIAGTVPMEIEDSDLDDDDDDDTDSLGIAQGQEENIEVTENSEEDDEISSSSDESSSDTPVISEGKRKHTGLAGFFIRLGNGFENFFVSIYNWFRKLFS